MAPSEPELMHPDSSIQASPPAASRSTGRYRGDIDGLRAIAVLAVVTYHYLPGWMPGGFVGVDVFFVISGFLITQLNLRRIHTGTFSFVDFYARRARRLLPAMAVVVVATLLIARWLYSPEELSKLGHSATAAALYGANIHHFLTSDYFVAPVETRPLLHLWSLGVEEQFYFVAPLGLWALARRPRALWWVAVGCVVTSFTACVWATHASPEAAFYLTPFRMWELGLGALLGIRPWSVGSTARRTVLGWAGFALVLSACVAFDHNTRFPGWIALLPTVGAALLVGAGPDHPIGRMLSVAPLRAVGRWSYAWYLWHWPALAFLTFVLVRAPNVLEAIGLAVGTLGLAAASTRFVETPLRHWRPDRPWQAILFGLGLSLLLSMVGLSSHVPDRGRARTYNNQSTDALLESGVTPCDALPIPRWFIASCAPGTGSAPPDFLVWGDSHVAVLGPLFDQWAHAGDRTGRLLGYNDCPPILGVDRTDLPTDHRCAEHNELVFGWIRRTRPEVVVLHARWPLVFEGTRYADTELPDPQFIQAGSVDRAPRLIESLALTVQRLQELDVQVVLLGPVPEATIRVDSVYQRAMRLGLKMPDGTDRASTDARLASSQRALETVARQRGVPLLEPASLLCDAARCAITQDDGPLYSDDNHLFPQKALLLMPLLESLPASRR
ncbi:MAG: hypothetical protein CL927_11635 [Deltaproteobacteria bacterium]|nr:hypothetical protein [Deltaproteobacteria bacterium]HCH62924.1 hypothetical protein [Deltaproteobacteria bacterium]